jgi:hypothetical protein
VGTLGRRSVGAAIAATVAMSAGVGVLRLGSAVAQVVEPCAKRTVSRPFTAWGDNNAYFVAPGGTFESAAWPGSSTARVSGNAPWRINGASQAWSMQIKARGIAVSTQFCVNSDEDSMRLFFKAPGVRGAKLRLHIDVVSGVNRATNDYDIDGGTAGWALLPRIMLPDIRDASGRQYVTITLTAAGSDATWFVDDVMIDPWKAI